MLTVESLYIIDQDITVFMKFFICDGIVIGYEIGQFLKAQSMLTLDAEETTLDQRICFFI